MINFYFWKYLPRLYRHCLPCETFTDISLLLGYNSMFWRFLYIYLLICLSCQHGAAQRKSCELVTFRFPGIYRSARPALAVLLTIVE